MRLNDERVRKKFSGNLSTAAGEDGDKSGMTLPQPSGIIFNFCGNTSYCPGPHRLGGVFAEQGHRAMQTDFGQGRREMMQCPEPEADAGCDIASFENSLTAYKVIGDGGADIHDKHIAAPGHTVCAAGGGNAVGTQMSVIFQRYGQGKMSRNLIKPLTDRGREPFAKRRSGLYRGNNRGIDRGGKIRLTADNGVIVPQSGLCGSVSLIDC